MSASLLTPAELAAQIPADSTPDKCVAIWIDLMRTCDKFLMAGLRAEVGPQGDVQAAYRKWYSQQCEEHDRVVRHMLAELERRESKRDDRSHDQDA